MNAPIPLRRFLGIHGHRRRKAREAAGRAIAKNDVLLKEQLPAWFTQVRALPNRTVAAYLHALTLCERMRFAAYCEFFPNDLADVG